MDIQYSVKDQHFVIPDASDCETLFSAPKLLNALVLAAKSINKKTRQSVARTVFEGLTEQFVRIDPPELPAIGEEVAVYAPYTFCDKNGINLQLVNLVISNENGLVAVTTRGHTISSECVSPMHMKLSEFQSSGGSFFDAKSIEEILGQPTKGVPSFWVFDRNGKEAAELEKIMVQGFEFNMQLS